MLGLGKPQINCPLRKKKNHKIKIYLVIQLPLKK